jgi:WXG100 family type VII secretion target
MQKLITQLQSEWEGAAAREFEQQFQMLKPSFEKMRTLIDDIASQLRASAEAVEQMDQGMASSFKIG